MWALADAIAKSQYKPYYFTISYVLILAVNVLMFILKGSNPLLASIMLIAGYFLVTIIIWRTSMRVYNFMDRDGRSTADYLHFRKYGFYSLLCLAGPLIFLASRNNPNLFSIIVTLLGAVIDVLLILFTQARYGKEFGPMNGRYTFGLKVALSRQMSQEQLQALCWQYKIPF